MLRLTMVKINRHQQEKEFFYSKSMQRTIDIVIGLGFGDEGKGITTDYLCSRYLDNNTSSGVIVVRFSGGQQAGHTVVHNGIRHVHSNFGSGTLRGVPTYFTEHCTVSISQMDIEKEYLSGKGIKNPKVYVHPLAKLTTPFDIAYNQVNSENLSHGSCGQGVGATMDRHNKTGYKLFAVDLMCHDLLFAKLKEIDLYYRRKILERYPEASNIMCEYTRKARIQMNDFTQVLLRLPLEIRDYHMLSNYQHIVFEGSQGVLLDMDHGIFPNVTYANTTSKNALEVYEKIYTENDIFNRTNYHYIKQIYYVTRCYQTRHGVGWMSNSHPIDLVNGDDATNKKNEYQGEFRISEIDYELLKQSIRIDQIYSDRISKNLVVTCMDQRPGFNFKTYELGCSFRNVLTSHSPDSLHFYVEPILPKECTPNM